MDFYLVLPQEMLIRSVKWQNIFFSNWNCSVLVNYALLFWSAVDFETIICFVHELRFPRKFLKCFLQEAFGAEPLLVYNILEFLKSINDDWSSLCYSRLHWNHAVSGFKNRSYFHICHWKPCPLILQLIFGEGMLTLAGTVDMKFVCICSVSFSEGSSCHWSGYSIRVTAGDFSRQVVVVIQAKSIGVVRKMNRWCRSRSKSSKTFSLWLFLLLRN